MHQTLVLLAATLSLIASAAWAEESESTDIRKPVNVDYMANAPDTTLMAQASPEVTAESPAALPINHTAEVKSPDAATDTLEAISADETKTDDAGIAPSPGPITPSSPFIRALVSAYETNPMLKAEQEALKAADESVAQALSGFRPNAGANYERGRARTDISNGWDYHDTTSQSLTIEQPLFNGFETLYGFQSAKQRVKSARQRLREVEQQVLYDAADAYSDVLEKQSVMQLAQSNVEVLDQQLKAVTERFDVGELTETDVAQARARLAKADAELRRAEGDLKATQATFVRVVGFTADNLLPSSMLPPLPATLDEALAIAEKQNPTLLGAIHDEKASNYEIGSRTGVLLPDVSLRGNMSRTKGGSIVNQLDTDSVTVNVSVPLYQSGAEYSRIREAKNQYQQSKYLSIDVKNAVIEAVTRTFENYQASLAVITSTQASVDAAEIAKEGVKQESDFGLRTILDVLDAEQELFESKVNLVRANRAKVLQAYQLLAAIGKLNASDLNLDVSTYDPTAHYNEIKWLPAGL